MIEIQLLIFAVIILALLFDFINGFHDSANAIATSISTRAISPMNAILMAAALDFIGAMVSTGVAKTIGEGVVSSAELIDEKIIIAALMGAVIWNIATWYFAIPSSSSHALVGGLIGAVLVGTFGEIGFAGLNLHGIFQIVIALIASPCIAILTGFIVMRFLLLLFGRMNPHVVNRRFRRAQIVSAAMMAFSHGSNDAQKSMGIITLALVAGGFLEEFEVPMFVKILCASSMALGVACGGMRMVKTVGGKIFKLEPISGFSADLNSSLTILTATIFHLPVSTTHVVSGSILGVGTAKRVNAVHWGVAQQMVSAWILTIPISTILSGTIYFFVARFF